MNTANLQLEGLLLALSALLSALESKGLLTRQELDAALDHAAANARTDQRHPSKLSAAHADAISFPIRFLQLAIGRTAN